jgi:folate-dependent phosphoribosylglycinamide formyltransferase PurN
MKKLVYDPAVSGQKMNIVCFISGSGTNYREIAARNPNHNYLVFTNRPGCGGVAIAKQNNHAVIELSQGPFLEEAKKKYAPKPVPRNCPERVQYEQEVSRLIESQLGKEPDLVCLAGYDQWITDWMVDKYYPRILNVHPGDTTKGYAGLHWVPAAKAIFGGDRALRSTLFFVDKSEDTGPVLVQSAPLSVIPTLQNLESQGKKGLIQAMKEVVIYGAVNNIKSYEEFKQKAGKDLNGRLELICSNLQDALKVAGDWKIYPFAVHDLIGAGRVEVDEKKVFLDGKELPAYGYRMDEPH